MPSYKRNFDNNNYKNKKDQAPSYTDRILIKNNTCNTYETKYYKCLENVFGSDHRPIV